MKLQKLPVLFVFFLLSFCAFAQSSLLWKIEGQNITQPTYLFGTIHLIPGSAFKVSPTLDSIAGKMDNIFFEMDLSHPDLANITAKKLMLDSVSSIKELYSASEYKKLVKKWTKMNIPYVLFEKFKPFMLQQQIMTTLVENPKGYETHFLAYAKKKKIKVGGLDEPEVQLANIDSIPLKLQAKSLFDLTMKPEKSRQELKLLFEKYQSNDIDVIFDYINTQKDFSTISNSLLDVRNIRWVEKMISLFDTNESYLFAVGAAHMGGPQGLINLLREKGYSVTAVKNE